MRKIIALLMVVSVISLLMAPTLEARGGRGGGGRGGGGRSMQRSPSMSRSPSRSRPTHQVARSPAPRQQPRRTTPAARTTRPAAERAFVEGRTPTRSNVQQFLDQSPGRGDGIARSGTPRHEKAQRNRGNRNDVGRDIRNNVGNRHPGRGDWFNDNFWRRHNYKPRYHLRDGNAWKWATWAGLTGWVGWSWGTPYYYDYGYYDDEDYEDGSYVYAEDTTQDYTQQTQEIATTVEEQQDSDWMSLGVFSLVKDRDAIGTPNVYIQLAINREGNIAGTFYNTTTDKTYPLEGLVDTESQRAAWMMADSKNAPILETGIYNLTKDETPVRITFADNSTQDVLLVRLEDPNK